MVQVKISHRHELIKRAWETPYRQGESYVTLKHLVATTEKVFVGKLSQSATKQSIKQYNTYRFKRKGSNGKNESSWFMKDRLETALLDDEVVATGSIILLLCSIMV